MTDRNSWNHITDDQWTRYEAAKLAADIIGFTDHEVGDLMALAEFIRLGIATDELEDIDPIATTPTFPDETMSGETISQAAWPSAAVPAAADYLSAAIAAEPPRPEPESADTMVDRYPAAFNEVTQIIPSVQ